MLVTSIFSFSQNVFKSFFLQGWEDQRLFGKGFSVSISSVFILLFFPSAKIFLGFISKAKLILTLTLSRTSPGFHVSAVEVV